jgi:hypothetical protein
MEYDDRHCQAPVETGNTISLPSVDFCEPGNDFEESTAIIISWQPLSAVCQKTD